MSTCKTNKKKKEQISGSIQHILLDHESSLLSSETLLEDFKVLRSHSFYLHHTFFSKLFSYFQANNVTVLKCGFARLQIHPPNNNLFLWLWCKAKQD